MSSSDQESCASNGAPTNHAGRIRRLNDGFRTSSRGGRILITSGVQSLGSEAVQRILLSVRDYDQFSPENDPHHEHDFGSFTSAGHRICWKIDYYDTTLAFGSPDASNAACTIRVLTIMLASEY